MQLLRSVVAKNYRSLWKHQSRVFCSLRRNNDGKSTMESGTKLAMTYGILATLGGSLSAYGWHLHADRVVLREKNESEFFKLKALRDKLDREHFEKLEQLTKQQEELDKRLEKLDKGQEEVIKRLIIRRVDQASFNLSPAEIIKSPFYRDPTEIIKSY